MEVRLLTAADAASYQGIRLRSLQEHPEAFGAAYEEEAEIPVEKIAEQLVGSLPNNPVFGAVSDGQLVGIVSMNRHPRLKSRHRAYIGGMYVLPAARSKGAGKLLLDAALDYAHSQEGLEDVILAVTVGNDTARNLYLKAGFTPYNLDSRYIRVGDQYFDIEWMIFPLAKT